MEAETVGREMKNDLVLEASKKLIEEMLKYGTSTELIEKE